jgi:hypothetical protein
MLLFSDFVQGKRKIAILLAWDKGSYTWGFLYICILTSIGSSPLFFFILP